MDRILVSGAENLGSNPNGSATSKKNRENFALLSNPNGITYETKFACDNSVTDPESSISVTLSHACQFRNFWRFFIRISIVNNLWRTLPWRNLNPASYIIPIDDSDHASHSIFVLWWVFRFIDCYVRNPNILTVNYLRKKLISITFY